MAALADRHGVARWYRGVNGARVAASADTLVGVLRALGVDTSGRDWIAHESRRLDAARAAQLVEPVVVAWDGLLPRGAWAPDARASLRLEDGARVTPGTAALPSGYHTLEVERASRSAEALVISAPRLAWSPAQRTRHRGVYAPLYALHRTGNYGPGDLSDLEALLDWVAAHGGDTVLTLPLLASFLDPPAEPSPYSPVSRLMWNELYAVLPRRSVPAAAEGLLDYDAAAAATRDALGTFVQGVDRDAAARADVEAFLAARPDVVDYARFRAAGERHGRNWRVWPARLRNGPIGATDIDAGAARYHEVAQWLMEAQLGALAARARRAGRLLGLDLALGTHPDGYDVWRHRDDFAHAASVGAPPDLFFVGGQGWGFPPLLPAAARAAGHRYFRAALRHHLRHAGLLRLDHVMSLHRLYWIPPGATPAEGAYVRYPGDELFAIITLESHRAGAVIVAENLGVVPAITNQALQRHGLLGTWVGQWAIETLAHAAAFDRPPRRSLASLNTHDMPTLRGFLEGRDIEDRRALGQIDDDATRAQHAARAEVRRRARAVFGARDDGGLLDGLLDLLNASNATIALSNLEDLWLEPRPQNVPGTSTERPNWRRPAAHPIDRLDDIPAVAARADRLLRPS